ncbi:hypothetical protein VNI00_002280 [Paramarasmius palmivorus]|uniref:Clr5 domain-containing protein n=1 Tax=Paramarasmius palmivorus TaxID=297713 RepID=A0AAW0E3U1_9AGAR
MSASSVNIFAVSSTENAKKRKRNVATEEDASDIYDSNGKTRRVNPAKLAERLDPGLVKEMDAYIKPGAYMPSFAIRKELQERYQVDRRHLYDYFHSRGLRVAKEDRHSNLTRSRQAKAAAAAASAMVSNEPRTSSHTPKDASLPVKKTAQKATKAPRLPLTPAHTNAPILAGAEESHPKSSLEDCPTSKEECLVYPKSRTPSPEPEFSLPVKDVSPPIPIRNDSSSYELGVLSVPNYVMDATQSSLPSPLAEHSIDATFVEHPDESTLIQDDESFCPVAFAKETADFDLSEYLNLDLDAEPVGVYPFFDTTPTPMINLDSSMSLSDRQGFYDLVKDAPSTLHQGSPVVGTVPNRVPVSQSSSAQRTNVVTQHSAGFPNNLVDLLLNGPLQSDIQAKAANRTGYPPPASVTNLPLAPLSLQRTTQLLQTSRTIPSAHPSHVVTEDSKPSSASCHCSAQTGAGAFTMNDYMYDYSIDSACLGVRPSSISFQAQQRYYQYGPRPHIQRSSRFRAISAGGI